MFCTDITVLILVLRVPSNNMGYENVESISQDLKTISNLHYLFTRFLERRTLVRLQPLITKQIPFAKDYKQQPLHAMKPEGLNLFSHSNI